MFEEDKKRPKFNQHSNLFIFLIFVALVAVFYFSDSEGMPVSLEFDEYSMTLQHPTDSSLLVEIEYQDILSVSDVSRFNVGQKVSGTDDDQFLFGVWENEAYGQYTLCASPLISHYIILTTVDGVVVFTYGDSAVSQELCKAISQQLQTDN